MSDEPSSGAPGERVAGPGAVPDSTARRVGLAVAGVPVVVAAYTLAYSVGMRRLEGEPVSLTHSLRIVLETMLTSGFGGDAPWQTAAMEALVTVMSFTGLAIQWLATLGLAVVVVRWFGDR